MPVIFRFQDWPVLCAQKILMHEVHMCRRSGGSKSSTPVQPAGPLEQRSTMLKRKGMQSEWTEMTEQRIGSLESLLKSRWFVIEPAAGRILSQNLYAVFSGHLAYIRIWQLTWKGAAGPQQHCLMLKQCMAIWESFPCKMLSAPSRFLCCLIADTRQKSLEQRSLHQVQAGLMQ